VERPNSDSGCSEVKRPFPDSYLNSSPVGFYNKYKNTGKKLRWLSEKNFLPSGEYPLMIFLWPLVRLYANQSARGAADALWNICVKRRGLISTGSSLYIIVKNINYKGNRNDVDFLRVQENKNSRIKYSY